MVAALSRTCPSRRAGDFSSIEQNDLLVLWSAGTGIRVQSKPPERIVKERTPDFDLGFPASHAVVERDDLRLRFRKIGVGGDLQRDLGMPLVVVGGRGVALLCTSDLEHPGQQEVLEAFVGQTERSRVPAE